MLHVGGSTMPAFAHVACGRPQDTPEDLARLEAQAAARAEAEVKQLRAEQAARQTEA